MQGVGIGRFKLPRVIRSVSGSHAALETIQLPVGAPSFERIMCCAQGPEPLLDLCELFEAGSARRGRGTRAIDAHVQTRKKPSRSR